MDTDPNREEREEGSGDMGGINLPPSSKVRLPEHVTKLRKRNRSEDRMLGRFCANTTLCASCHPRDCPKADCHGFTANDVAAGHVGRSCDRCGQFLPGSERREV